ncbi:hypothetical protein PUNSTDRAFT_54931 [Punctularia strigosozonata HHB-11173 SS5]|uniref:uncharacterized protein n=1 Tax=Punctularia strigosozonata (strain HHB-11173) TaxID=741275 RepID=UPI0004416CC7|nr:uncharacterized protein PUNSTDRAFT_54931 [Punctularia strigosozonata HHB-11173 SS5]EIN05556.1 hypothetical protein PUNSTDRAFT_54931 [Punctularia strigosozonata HHB-11173 SS5]
MRAARFCVAAAFLLAAVGATCSSKELFLRDDRDADAVSLLSEEDALRGLQVPDDFTTLQETTPGLKCKFRLSGQEFDLCPLFDARKGQPPIQIEWDDETPPTITTTRFTLQVTHRLWRNKTLSEKEQCPPGTWVCKTVLNRLPGKRRTRRITQMVPLAGTLARHPDHNHTDDKESDRYFTRLNMTVRTRTPEDGPHDAFILSLHGGEWAKRNQTASFAFVCDHNAEEPTSPNWVWQWGSWHVFRWKTRHACSKNLTPDKGSGGDAGGDERNPSLPPKEDTGAGEQPIYDPEPDSELVSGGRLTWGISGVILSGLVIMLTLYLLTHPRFASKRRTLLAYMPAFGAFLVSRAPILAALFSRILPALSKIPIPSFLHSVFPFSRMRGGGAWSDEDTARFLAFDADAEGAEDEMVDGPGYGGYPPRPARSNEEIPLTPSPRKASFGPISGYGTVGSSGK